MGANPAHGVKEEDGSFAQCIDLIGESWPHRAVRYGERHWSRRLQVCIHPRHSPLVP